MVINSENAIHNYREWSGRVSFLLDGIKSALNPEQLAFFGPLIEDVLSWTPKKLEETNNEHYR